MDRSLALLAALVLAVPAASLAEDLAPPAPPKTPAPAAADPVKVAETLVGEVVTLPLNHSAAYGPAVVRGPGINLTDMGNGEWKGNVKDLSGVFTVTEKRISGANMNLVMDRDGDEWTCQGTVDGKRVRIVLSRDSLVARYDNRFYELTRVRPDLWATMPTGPAIRVKGDAATASPYYPQFIFALLAVL